MTDQNSFHHLLDCYGQKVTMWSYCWPQDSDLWLQADFVFELAIFHTDTNHIMVHQLDSAKVGLWVVWPSPFHWVSVAALAHLLLCEVTGCKLPAVPFPIWKVTLLLSVGPSTTVIDIPFKQCYTIKFTAKILPWWLFSSAAFFCAPSCSYIHSKSL